MTEDGEATTTEEAKDFWRDWYSNSTLIGLIMAMHSVADSKGKAEEELKNINIHYDLLRIELIPAKMEEEGIENIKVEGVGRISLTGDMWVSVPAAHRDAFYDWLRGEGLGDLIKPTVNASTLKAMIKGRMQKGQEIPDEIIKVTPFTRASITKA